MQRILTLVASCLVLSAPTFALERSVGAVSDPSLAIQRNMRMPICPPGTPVAVDGDDFVCSRGVEVYRVDAGAQSGENLTFRINACTNQVTYLSTGRYRQPKVKITGNPARTGSNLILLAQTGDSLVSWSRGGVDTSVNLSSSVAEDAAGCPIITASVVDQASGMSNDTSNLKTSLTYLVVDGANAVTVTSTNDWITGGWGSCSGGRQTRTVQCQNGDGDVQPDSACSDTKPAVMQSCGGGGGGNGGQNGNGGQR